MKAVISGSFKKYFNEITQAAKKLQQEGIEVIAPQISPIVNPGKEFILLEKDNGKLPYEIEMDFMENIEKVDFLYVINAGNYIGESVSAEISHAKLHNIPVIYSCGDIPIQELNIEGIKEMLHLLQKELTQEEIEICTHLRDTLLEKLKHTHV